MGWFYLMRLQAPDLCSAPFAASLKDFSSSAPSITSTPCSFEGRFFSLFLMLWPFCDSSLVGYPLFGGLQRMSSSPVTTSFGHALRLMNLNRWLPLLCQATMSYLICIETSITILPRPLSSSDPGRGSNTALIDK